MHKNLLYILLVSLIFVILAIVFFPDKKETSATQKKELQPLIDSL
ncbi:MAG: hypothetical protein KIH67_001435 [Candidatus Moranbacteria bacterium]|nr:hypothetical protein [Candidatus Moranbacteria bacterium]